MQRAFATICLARGREKPHNMKPSRINILIACEESQAITLAFRERGFNAFSCDIQRCRKGGNPEYHILGDATPLLKGKTKFRTQSGKYHQLKEWHLIIAHPPCTYLCRLNACRMKRHGILDAKRYEGLLAGREFFYKCLNAKAHYVAVENPVPLKMAKLPKPTTYIQPSDYGHKYTKKTCFWLKNLPPLLPVIIYPNPKSYVERSRGKYRARTFPNVAKAIAEQWGNIILNEMR